MAPDAIRLLHITFEGEELRVDSMDQQWQIDAAWWEHRPVNPIHYRLDHVHTGGLLESLQAHSAPFKAATIGVIGRDH